MGIGELSGCCGPQGVAGVTFRCAWCRRFDARGADVSMRVVRPAQAHCKMAVYGLLGEHSKACPPPQFARPARSSRRPQAPAGWALGPLVGRGAARRPRGATHAGAWLRAHRVQPPAWRGNNGSSRRQARAFWKTSPLYPVGSDFPGTDSATDAPMSCATLRSKRRRGEVTLTMFSLRCVKSARCCALYTLPSRPS